MSGSYLQLPQAYLIPELHRVCMNMRLHQDLLSPLGFPLRSLYLHRWEFSQFTNIYIYRERERETERESYFESQLRELATQQCSRKNHHFLTGPNICGVPVVHISSPIYTEGQKIIQRCKSYAS